MRKALVVILFILSVSTGFSQVKLAGYVKTIGSADTYPTHIDSIGYGGYRVTYNRITRNAIPSARSRIGMMVRYIVYDSTFILTGSNPALNSSWTAVQWFPGFGTSGSTAAYGNHNHSGVYEPVISSGTTGQYWRGDKSWQTLPTYSAGYGLSLSGSTFNNTRFWKNQDTLKTTLSGLIKATSGVLTTITDNSSNWNTAYGWGNHASASYEVQSNKLNSTSTSTTKYPTWNAAKNYMDSIKATITVPDTTSLSNRINTKQNISDTNSVDATRHWVRQQAYVTGTPWTSVGYELQSNKKNSTSTSTTKYPTWYAAKAYVDSVKGTIPTTDTTFLSNRINLKQNISDTGTVDATRYWVNQKGYELQSNKQNSTSTSTTKYPTWYAAKAYMDSIKGTIPTTDTTFLSNRINAKQSYTDTNSYDATRHYVDSSLLTIDESQWINAKPNIYYNEGFVGVGTNDPTVSFEVDGDVKISDSVYMPGLDTVLTPIHLVAHGVDGQLQTISAEKIMANPTVKLVPGFKRAPYFDCGNDSIVVSHSTSNGVAPVNKTTTYYTVKNIAGEPNKCWITKNLGATKQPSAYNDTSEAARGWYWQFNQKKGFKYNGQSITPSSGWLTSNIENSNWIADKDPCNLELGAGWRIPTYYEWYNVNTSSQWITITQVFESDLKLAIGGYLFLVSGVPTFISSNSISATSTQQGEMTSYKLGNSVNSPEMYGSLKTNFHTTRCIKSPSDNDTVKLIDIKYIDFKDPILADTISNDTMTITVDTSRFAMKADENQWKGSNGNVYRPTGKVAIGVGETYAFTDKLHVVGDARITGTINTTSTGNSSQWNTAYTKRITKAISPLVISNDTISIPSVTSTKVSQWNRAFSMARLDSTKWVGTDRCGFWHSDSVTVTYDESTHVVTLAPKSPLTTWKYFRNGGLYTITGLKTYDLDDVSGGLVDGYSYFVYIDDTVGTLTAKNQTDPWTLLDSRIPVAVVNWDATAYPKYWLSQETHQALIDRRMHYVEHSTEGTKLIVAPTLSGATAGGTTDAANTFKVSISKIANEDMIHTLDSLSDPTGATGTGAYVVFYHSGGSWKWDTTDVPFKFTANSYIEYDNGTTTVTGTQPKYYNTYLLLTNRQGAARHTIVLGRTEYSTAAEAYGETPISFDWTGFPIQESVICYQMTWQTSSSLSTKGKCKLARLPQRITSSISTAITPVSTVVTSAPITGNGSTASPISITQAGVSSSGYLSSNDFNTFYQKVSSQWDKNEDDEIYITNPVGIGTSDPTQTLSVGGSISVSNNLYFDSKGGSRDHGSSGDCMTLVAGATNVIGDVIFIGETGKTAICKADAIANCPYALAICVSESVTANADGIYMTKGVVRDDSWNWTTGAILYIKSTAISGSCLTHEAPSATNNVIMPVAIAIDADRIYFFGNINSVEKN